MNSLRTVLLMSRGKRLHVAFREMALDLVRDHRVVVLAAPEYVESFTAAGIDARPYETGEMSQRRGRYLVAESSIELDDISRIERELKLSAHKAASNYVLYGRIVKSDGGIWSYIETENDVLDTYVRAYRQLSELFRLIRPDVVFYETIDMISSYVAMAMAVREEVFGLEFRFAPLGEGKIMPAYGLERQNPLLEYLNKHPDEIERSSYLYADEVLKAVPEHMHRGSYSRLHRNMVHSNARSLRRRLMGVAGERERIARGLRNLRWHWNSARNRRWVERNLARQLPNRPYIVFFMQYLPEASSSSEAPRWVYPGMIVEQLSINAPAFLTIAVKEHPLSYRDGRRGQAFFRPLQYLPNVYVCHPSVDTSDLIAHAEAIVVVTSTVGLEGVLSGKRVAVLGRPFYSGYGGVRRLDHPADLFPLLDDAAWRPDAMVAERRQFLAAYLQSLQDFGVGAGTSLYPDTSGANWGRALRRTADFLDSRGLKPSDFNAGL